MYLFQILLPRTDNSGKPFPKKEYHQIKEELATQFEGVTAYLRAPAEGLWRQGAKSAHDDIVIFEVMADQIDLAAWRSRRAQLEHRFRQNEIVIRYLSVHIV